MTEGSLTHQLITAAVEAAILLLGAAIAWGRSGLKGLIQSRVEQVHVRTVLSRVTDCIFTLVQEAQQTTVEDLKKARADGRITEDEYRQMLRDIKKAVVDKAKELLSTALTGKLQLSEAKASEYIAAKVESAVLELKADKALPLE